MYWKRWRTMTGSNGILCSYRLVITPSFRLRFRSLIPFEFWQFLVKKLEEWRKCLVWYFSVDGVSCFVVIFVCFWLWLYSDILVCTHIFPNTRFYFVCNAEAIYQTTATNPKAFLTQMKGTPPSGFENKLRILFAKSEINFRCQSDTGLARTQCRSYHAFVRIMHFVYNLPLAYNPPSPAENLRITLWGYTPGINFLHVRIPQAHWKCLRYEIRTPMWNRL